MTQSKKTEIIMQALEALGYTKIRELQIDSPAHDRANVYLNGEYFGVYDFVRRTFVD